MTRKIPSTLFNSIIVAAVALFVAATAQADPGKPTFGPALYGDGELWGTKGTTSLPAPTAKNSQSFDGLYIIINGHADQKPVAEAAPGNSMYNGGRWIAYTVEWTAGGIAAHGGNVPLIISFAELWLELDDGHVTITAGHPDPLGPDYFQCPLLPNKGN